MHLHRFHALGGPCSLRFWASDAVAAPAVIAAAEAETRRIEAKYSRYRADSIVSRINASAGSGAAVTVDDETAQLLDFAATAHAQSDGLFDVTSGVLRRAWDFRAGTLPAPGAIEALLPRVGWQHVRWRRPHLTLPVAGMELDFGGFGKEYAVDAVCGVLASCGVRHGLVEFAGDLRVVGPQPDGSPWEVGIQHPRDLARPIARVPLGAGAIATSGDYERFFERDGRRYCHILDPRTGYPVEGLASVSILAGQCLLAGTLATIAMLKGAQAPAWLAAAGLPWLTVSAAGRVAGSIETRSCG